MTARILRLSLAALLFSLGYWMGRKNPTPSPAPILESSAELKPSPAQPTAPLPHLGGYNAEIDHIVSQLLAAKPINLEHDLARHAEGLFYLLFESYAADQPELAAQLALQIQDPGRRRFALEEAGKNWGSKNPRAAFAWLNQLEPADYKMAFDATYSRVASGDPTYAAQQLATVTDPAIRKEAVHRAATELARADPHAAFDWLEQFPDPEERRLAHNAALLAHVMAKPIEAFPRLQAMPEGNTKRELAQTLGSALASDDLETSLLWARDIKDPSLQTSVLEGISYELDVAFADGQFHAELKNLPTAQAPALIDALLPLIQRAFDRAAANIANLPPAKAEFLAQRVATQWSHTDAAAARNWANTLPPGPVRDTALRSLVTP